MKKTFDPEFDRESGNEMRKLIKHISQCRGKFVTAVAVCMALSLPVSAAAPDTNLAQVKRSTHGLENAFDAAMESSPFFSPADIDQDTRALANRFILSAGLDKGLGLLILDQVKTDPFIMQAVEDHGMQMVQMLVVMEIKKSVQKNRLAWSDMLAGIYAQHLSKDVLLSVMKKREASPHFAAFVNLQKKIGETVSTQGSAIFETAKASTLSAIHAHFSSLKSSVAAAY